MKVKELGYSVAYTYQPAPYHAIKGEASVLVSLEEDDKEEDVKEYLKNILMEDLVRNLAGLDQIHHKIYAEGYTPNQLAGEEEHEEEWTEF